MWVCAHDSIIAQGGQRSLRSAELELQMVVHPAMKVLGTELGSSARAASTLDCIAISLDPASKHSKFIILILMRS